MPCYESVFIARQDISASQAEGLTETFSQIISGNGGNVVNTESWGLRSISYRIKKNRKGHYVLMNIDAPAPAVHEMERQMRIHEDVLRYMTIRVDGFEEGPSAMLRNKDRDDRPRRNDRNDRGDRGDRPSRFDEDKPEVKSDSKEGEE
ncbi:30S ribosomal protein S6 [Thalassospiraceae bacterium LMO-JJ14]|nr:30S ribosomal protein S6 [Thalassospiraceae bacterium LMO-JJ14]